MILGTIKLILNIIKLGSACMFGASIQKKLDELTYQVKSGVNNATNGFSHAADELSRRAASIRLPEVNPEKYFKVEEEDIKMSKSTFAAILAFLACAVGALTAFAIYLWKREKELSEYEELLFSVDEEEAEEEANTEAAVAAEEEIVIPVEEAPAAEEAPEAPEAPAAE